MNKKDLARAVSKDLGTTVKDTEVLLESVFKAISDELVLGSEVNITGFGKFVIVEKPARNGRNPRTGETITVEAHRAVKFKPAGTLKQSVY